MTNDDPQSPASRSLSRRAALVGGVAAAGAAVVGGRAAWADAPMGGVARPSAYRFKLGGYEVATFLDGAFQLDGPHPIFGEDQNQEAMAALMRENFLPEARVEFQFAPVLINTGAQLVLIDTGNGEARAPNAGRLAEAMAGLGYAPEQVDVVMITHLHPDHIGGMTTGGAPTFPNATYVAPRVEFDFWRANAAGVRGDDYAALLERNVFSFADRMRFVEDEGEIAPGVTALAAYGHTPGHMIVHVESEGRRLVITSDTANHFVASLQRPDWHVRFDMDKGAAAATRKRVFDMVAADRVPFTGYHMPFPAVGYVEPLGEGYRYVPAAYQLNL